MLNFKQTVLNIYYKVKKLLIITIICLMVISMLVAPKTVRRKAFISKEEAQVNLALNHNQCLSYGHVPNTYEYFNCMEELHKQKISTISI